MSFPFPRLPLLAIKEVIKSMRTREIFLLSLASKKSTNFMILSIPKDSLLAKFTFREDGFQFELKPDGYIKSEVNIFHPVALRITEGNSEITGFSTCGLYIQCQWTYTSEIEESIWKLFYRFSKTFKNSKYYIRFENGTREEFAMEMMRFAWGNDFLLGYIDFCLGKASSESIHELLNRCSEHHTSLYIGTKLPKGFICTPPPGGYKLKSFRVHDAHWVNLDDFLQCQSFCGGVPGLTVEYLNGLLKKIVNLECRLERFCFSIKSIKPSDFPAIVKGLNENKIQQYGRQKLQFERKDGLKLLVFLRDGYLSLKDDYLLKVYS